MRKMSLMTVRHPLAALVEFIAPRIQLSGETTTRRELPLCFGRQTLAGPLRVSERVFVRDMHDRKLRFAFDRAFWTEWMTPVGTIDERPPLEMIVERHRMIGRCEHDGPGLQSFRGCGGKVFLTQRSLGNGDIASRLHEALEL